MISVGMWNSPESAYPSNGNRPEVADHIRWFSAEEPNIMPDEKIKFRGNPHHLALLVEAVRKGDITLWNNYVRKNGSSFRARLAGADLTGFSLGEAKLAGADLTDADLTGAVLTRANLSNARLRGCSLIGADLTSARLNHTDFTKADLSLAKMSNARARGAILIDADLSGTILDGADLSKASMKGAEVTGTSRSGARMKVRVKVKSTSDKILRVNRFDRSSLDYSPWIKALDEETERKEMRQDREDKQAEADREQLDRKLGRRKPLFNRVK